jgi:predicted DNA-binding protein
MSLMLIYDSHPTASEWRRLMSSVITLPDHLYERLTSKSQQLERTPDDVVADLVRRYLSEPDDSWQAEFEALLARVHARTAAFSSDEMEADITLAAAEAKEARRARRAA